MERNKRARRKEEIPKSFLKLRIFLSVMLVAGVLALKFYDAGELDAARKAVKYIANETPAIQSFFEFFKNLYEMIV